MSVQVLLQRYLRVVKSWYKDTYEWSSPGTNEAINFCLLTCGQVLVPLEDVRVLVPLAQVPLLVKVGLSCKKCYFCCCRVIEMKN